MLIPTEGIERQLDARDAAWPACQNDRTTTTGGSTVLNRFLHLSALAFLVATFGLAAAPGTAVAGPLDQKYTQAQVEQWLYIEISDIFRQYDPDDEYADEDLVAAIMDALSDAPRAGMSDHHAQVHGYVSRRDLDAEMREAGTTLVNVVREAVYEADAMGLLDDREARPIYARWERESRADARPTPAGLLLAQQGDLSGRDNKARAGKAGRQAARNISAAAFNN
jgi:hypothetical protein